MFGSIFFRSKRYPVHRQRLTSSARSRIRIGGTLIFRGAALPCSRRCALSATARPESAHLRCRGYTGSEQYGVL